MLLWPYLANLLNWGVRGR